MTTLSDALRTATQALVSATVALPPEPTAQQLVDVRRALDGLEALYTPEVYSAALANAVLRDEGP